MSARSTIAALMITVGALAFAPTAAAVPQVVPPSHAEPGDYPLNGQGTTPKNSPKTAPETDERAEKAEKLGGGVATEVIDLITGIIKCGLNIATDSVPCKL
ncbi:hypothetical protein [Nocardia alba]|uniref:Secreted protein n=1 Tax=Nocardia alba TaxID=225051 RepID=A0A4R1G0D5_9NOCA|nr:hypothetical protein [Nocardia alba]TCJ99614.1 hypothetical protein DFR71_0595 [Nocardia alba]